MLKCLRVTGSEVAAGDKSKIPIQFIFFFEIASNGCGQKRVVACTTVIQHCNFFQIRYVLSTLLCIRAHTATHTATHIRTHTHARDTQRHTIACTP